MVPCLAIHDTMRHIKSDVGTVGFGGCMGMSGFLLAVVNESHRHAGHAGDDGSGESHFRVTIRAASFGAMSRVDRHRAVQKALGDLNTRIHALALDIGA